MKKAVIIVSYEQEHELNTFLAQNGTNLEVSSVYENLDSADQEHLEAFINEKLIDEEA